MQRNPETPAPPPDPVAAALADVMAAHGRYQEIVGRDGYDLADILGAVEFSHWDPDASDHMRLREAADILAGKRRAVLLKGRFYQGEILGLHATDEEAVRALEFHIVDLIRAGRLHAPADKTIHDMLESAWCGTPHAWVALYGTTPEAAGRALLGQSPPPSVGVWVVTDGECTCGLGWTVAEAWASCEHDAREYGREHYDQPTPEERAEACWGYWREHGKAVRVEAPYLMDVAYALAAMNATRHHPERYQ